MKHDCRMLMDDWMKKKVCSGLGIGETRGFACDVGRTEGHRSSVSNLELPGVKTCEPSTVRACMCRATVSSRKRMPREPGAVAERLCALRESRADRDQSPRARVQASAHMRPWSIMEHMVHAVHRPCTMHHGWSNGVGARARAKRQGVARLRVC